MRLDDILNRIVSGSAALIAIAALGTAVYQAKLSRDQAKASVWPYLIQGNSGNNGYARIIQNVGIGPAVIRSFEVTVDSQPVANWAAAAKAMGITLSWKGHRTTTFGSGLVLPTGALVDLLELPDSGDVRLIRAQIERLHTRVCYCSLYKDCWELTSPDHDPVPVEVCRENPARRFME
jgi:hypothetical protein